VRRKALALLPLAILTGCANQQADPNYQAYLAAVNAGQAAQATQQQKPLIDIKCLPNAPCSFASITVFAPPADTHSSQPQIAAPQPQVSPWAGVATSALGLLGNVAGYAYGAKAAIGIADALRDAGTTGYKYVQAPVTPGAVTNTTTTNTSVNTTNTTANVGGSGIANTGQSATPTTSSLTGSANPQTTTTTTQYPTTVK
jgi:hypothetical protein